MKLSEKITKLFVNEVNNLVKNNMAEVYELHDDIHKGIFIKIYNQSGLKSKYTNDNHKLKTVKKYIDKHIKTNKTPFIKKEYIRSFDYTTIIYSLCSKVCFKYNIV